MVRASGTLKNGRPGGPSKLDPFFCRFGGLAGGPRVGSRVHGSSIFTFSAEPKKGSKMGAKMERFGLQTLHYTLFLYPSGASLGVRFEIFELEFTKTSTFTHKYLCFPGKVSFLSLENRRRPPPTVKSYFYEEKCHF